MSFNLNSGLSLSATDLQHIYLKHGTEVTLEEAEKILEFISTLANIAVDQVLREEQKTASPSPSENSSSQDHNVY